MGYLRERVPVVRRRYGARGRRGAREGRDRDRLPPHDGQGGHGRRGARPAAAHPCRDHAARCARMTGSSRSPPGRCSVALREVGAFYRSALAQELAGEGYPIEQGTGRDGKYFEIAGVPAELRDAFSGRHREIAQAAERFRAKHGRAPERGEMRDIALENRRAKELTTRGDLQRVWARTGERHGFGADEAVHLVGAPSHTPPGAGVGGSHRSEADRARGRVRRGAAAGGRAGADSGGAEPRGGDRG